jgi:hypothetical protein
VGTGELLRAVIEQGLIAIQPFPVRYLLPHGVRSVAISDLHLQLDNYFIWKKSPTSPIVRALVGVYLEQYG